MTSWDPSVDLHPKEKETIAPPFLLEEWDFMCLSLNPAQSADTSKKKQKKNQGKFA